MQSVVEQGNLSVPASVGRACSPGRLSGNGVGSCDLLWGLLVCFGSTGIFPCLGGSKRLSSSHPMRRERQWGWCACLQTVLLLPLCELSFSC